MQNFKLLNLEMEFLNSQYGISRKRFQVCIQANAVLGKILNMTNFKEESKKIKIWDNYGIPGIV